MGKLWGLEEVADGDIEPFSPAYACKIYSQATKDTFNEPSWLAIVFVTKATITKNVPPIMEGTMSCHQCSASWNTVIEPLPTIASWIRTQKKASIAMRPFHAAALR